MRVVLDTNVGLQMLSRKSRYHQILQVFLDGGFSWVITTDVYLEYIEIIQQRSFPGADQLFAQVVMQSPDVADTNVHFFFETLKSDPDDNKFVDAYLAGGADYLVTWDRHFNELKQNVFPGVNVISPDEFLKVIAPDPPDFIPAMP